MRDFEKAPAQLSVTRQGDLCAAAINAPLEKAGLFARIAKLGNTPFTLGAEDAEIVIDEGINLSPASVNALRRECAEALESLFAKPLRALLGEDKGALLPSVSPFDIPRKSYGKLNTAIIFREELYRDLKNSGALSAAGFDIVFLPLEAEKAQGGEKIGAYIPPIIMESELASVAEQLRACREAGIKYALVGNISHLSLIAEYGFIAIADFRLNISNSSALELYSSLGVSAAVLSPELTLPMARDIGGGVIVAGRIPLMLTERCFIKENFGCDRCSRAEFTDRKGAKFPILKEAGHRNIIFNSTPTYMGDKAGELRSAGVSHCHTILSAETPKEARQLLESYRKGEPLSAPHRRMGKRS
jgi:putative protease